MLNEIRPTRQIQGEGFRRWFTDSDCDLVVWYPAPENPQIDGFQFCWDKLSSEQALTWNAKSGFRYSKVDSGDHGGFGFKSTPILRDVDMANATKISETFFAVSQSIDHMLRNFILDRLP